MEPSGRGGVASTMVLHPASPAGVHSMSALDGRTAVPPGTYTPTAPAPTHDASQAVRVSSAQSCLAPGTCD